MCGQIIVLSICNFEMGVVAIHLKNIRDPAVFSEVFAITVHALCHARSIRTLSQSEHCQLNYLFDRIDIEREWIIANRPKETSKNWRNTINSLMQATITVNICCNGLQNVTARARLVKPVFLEHSCLSNGHGSDIRIETKFANVIAPKERKKETNSMWNV